VAQTLIGVLKHDPDSFLNDQRHDRIGGGLKQPRRPDPIAPCPG
jgi:hypothetical protein